MREAHAEAKPRAQHQRNAEAAMPPHNGPPKRSQPPVQGPPAPRAAGPSADRGLQAKPAVSQDKQARPAGGQNIPQTNESHTMEPLPDPRNAEQVFNFAMSFNAYKRYGSLGAAAKIAEDAPRSTLDEVRAELFFKARASRHRGDDAYLETYKEILPLLEQLSKAGPT